ncbi:MAG: recombination regulator RecX [Clostridiales Family XIII bacterium]|jgi:regulatory protein|nr:recombination regulator RecX [Clostridiales Family XIII bacterium]
MTDTGRTDEESKRDSEPKEARSKKDRKTAYGKALDLLGRQPRTDAGLRLLLRKAGYTQDETDDALLRLTEDGYVDDASFAVRCLEILMEKRRGRRRAIDELRRKGIPEALARSTVAEGYPAETERENARSVAARALAEAGLDREKARRRVTLRLVGQGYDEGTIRSVLSEVAGGMRETD